VNKITRELASLGESEVPTSAIGSKVMNELAKIDDVAYIRYASVYSNFKNSKDFEKFVTNINKSKK
jgi:transcriptional repressor NrdR